MAQRLILAAACGLLVGAATAQPLADPTRPPARGGAPERQAEPQRATRLQSVLISSSRSIAVIDGRAVRVGERVGDATLVAIDPSHVTLRRGAARETLMLLPAGIDKKAVRR